MEKENWKFITAEYQLVSMVVSSSDLFATRAEHHIIIHKDSTHILEMRSLNNTEVLIKC